LVTGSSRGIGRAIAERLSNDGAKLVINYAGSADKANEVVAAIATKGGEAIAVQADVGKVSDIQRLFEQTRDRFGKLDILVNNAGTIFYKPIAQVTEEEFDKIFAINVKGTFFACQHATQHLAKELGGRGITVNVVSPGPTDTELFTADKTEEQIDRFAKMAALGRLGQVQDIADVVAFLASDDARWITGQNIRVNGGLA